MKRALLNLVITFLISIIISPLIIKWLRKLKFGQSILIYVEKHKEKSGTPTMGGIIFILSVVIGYLVFFNKNNTIATISILSLLFFGTIGFLDDFIKIKFKQNEGLKPYQKIIGQFGIAILIALFVYYSDLVGSSVIIPFTNNSIDLGVWIIPFVVFIYLAIVNSVNLIDGLDGLCGGVSSVVLIVISVILFLGVGNLSEVFRNEILNLIVVSFGLVGGILGFLIFNSYPAKVFMGDTGSLAIGGFLASLVSLTRQYFLVVIVGFAFVLTAMSVILQVFSYKVFKKRIIKMAPLHHHFEQTYHEVKVVASYVILSIIVGVLTISMYI